MKRRVIVIAILCFATLIISTSVQAQISDLKGLAPQKKGDIKLLDGTEISCKKLNVKGDTLYFETKTGLKQQVSGTEVYKVTRTGNYAAVYGISCAAGGLLGGILGTRSWNGTSLEDQKGGFIIGATVICGAVGAIVGALLKKEKVVYKNASFNYSFNSIRNDVLNEKYWAIGVTIKFNNKK